MLDYSGLGIIPSITRPQDPQGSGSTVPGTDTLTDWWRWILTGGGGEPEGLTPPPVQHAPDVMLTTPSASGLDDAATQEFIRQWEAWQRNAITGPPSPPTGTPLVLLAAIAGLAFFLAKR